jgi:hypothetical protein
MSLIILNGFRKSWQLIIYNFIVYVRVGINNLYKFHIYLLQELWRDIYHTP